MEINPDVRDIDLTDLAKVTSGGVARPRSKVIKSYFDDLKPVTRKRCFRSYEQRKRALKQARRSRARNRNDS